MQTIGVIGAGQMGSGIAQTIAQHGLKVLLTDRELAIAEESRAGIERALGKPKRRSAGLPLSAMSRRWRTRR